MFLRILIEVVVLNSDIFSFLSNPIVSWARWYNSVIPALAKGRQRWKEYKLEGSLGYTVSSGPLWRVGK